MRFLLFPNSSFVEVVVSAFVHLIDHLLNLQVFVDVLLVVLLDHQGQPLEQ